MIMRQYRFPCGTLRFATDGFAILEIMDVSARPWGHAPALVDVGTFDFTLTDHGCDGAGTLPPDASLLFTNELFPGVSFEYFSSGDARVFRAAGRDVVTVDYKRGVAHGTAYPQHPTWERNYLFSCVVLPPLVEWMARHRVYAFHGGIARLGEDGVVVSARGGSGKTTTVMALALGGFEFLSDDIGVLAVTPDGLRVLGVPEPINLCPDAPRVLAPLKTLNLAFSGDGKQAFDAEGLLGYQPGAACTPRLLLFPEVDASRETSLEPMPRGEAVEQLLPNGLFLTGMVEGRERFEAFLRLVEATWPMRLILGGGIECLPELVRRALEEAR